MSTEVPISMMLRVSTTCCCLPSGSGGTLEASLKSSCQCCIGLGRSVGSQSEADEGQCVPVSQEAMNGARGAWQASSRLLQALITSQVVQDRLGPWGASQSESPLVANIQESIHHQRVELRGDGEGLERDLVAAAHHQREHSRPVS